MNPDDLPLGPDDLDKAEQELTAIANRLAERFTGTFTHATVERYVFESYQALAASARLAAFLPALTERFADDRLVALASVSNPPLRPIPQVLFICDRNAARSQMAAALLEMQAPGRVNTLSAEYPKPLTDEFVAAADIVVTVGCGDACPVLPGKRYLDWTVPDPEGKDMIEVRRIRDELDLLVTDLLTYLPEAADGEPDDRKGTP